jgi:1-acyl-sn-glycerol-3-phosphate acyltransferase
LTFTFNEAMISPFFRRNHKWIALWMRGLVRVMAPRHHVTGRQHIPRRGPVIFASNHVSDSDPPVLGCAIRFPIAWMAKRELWSMGLLAPILDFFGCFPIDPASADRAALKKGFETLENGDGLVIFPEGKLSLDGELGPILPGALLLALKAGVTVVPVGIWGSQWIVPHGSTVPRPTLGPVRVHFGTPLCFDDLKTLPSRRARELALERLETALKAAREVAKRG